ncbi:hypothetical protein BH09SUM1_BH09SUM1_34460 [soil metagenome]
MSFLSSADYHARRLLLGAVHWYQRRLSWLLGGQCRFAPSCSCYAEEALTRMPLPTALRLIAWRIMRCQPFCRAGIDPVPITIRSAGGRTFRALPVAHAEEAACHRSVTDA